MDNHQTCIECLYIHNCCLSLHIRNYFQVRGFSAVDCNYSGLSNSCLVWKTWMWGRAQVKSSRPKNNVQLFNFTQTAGSENQVSSTTTSRVNVFLVKATAAIEDITTTLLIDGTFARDLRTLRVPFTAGSISSVCGLETVWQNGDAVWKTPSHPSTIESKDLSSRKSALNKWSLFFLAPSSAGKRSVFVGSSGLWTEHWRCSHVGAGAWLAGKLCIQKPLQHRKLYNFVLHHGCWRLRLITWFCPKSQAQIKENNPGFHWAYCRMHLVV